MPNSSECNTTFSTSSSNPINQLVAQTKGRDGDVDENHEMEKIPFSDVAVKRKSRAYWWRKWRTWDLTISIGLMVHFHIMCLVYAPSTFSWDAFRLGAFLALVTSLFGVSISYHRNLAHRAFNLPKWLEYFFAYCGILAFQGDPMFWVSMHRMHHQYTDKDQDPHSPTEGFWFSHINWLFDITYINQKRGGWKNVKDLEKQFFYRFLRKTNVIHPFLLGIPLFWWGGFPMVVYGLVGEKVGIITTTLSNSLQDMDTNGGNLIWAVYSMDPFDLANLCEALKESACKSDDQYEQGDMKQDPVTRYMPSREVYR
ncbi:hypothetical protein Scep_025655 [Stephania cephalantha]|uniref:Fatty acid desaturase domain-containing protein n=1 Tax=Stephania cephalantha TaxID=152367 RepID=A0AAP0HRS4_9MAGN